MKQRVKIKTKLIDGVEIKYTVSLGFYCLVNTTIVPNSKGVIEYEPEKANLKVNVYGQFILEIKE